MKIQLNISPLKSWSGKSAKPLIISGPCSAETEEQTLSTAKAVAEIDPSIIFRAGVWKARTRPNSFEGVGSPGLAWLAKVKHETGMMVATEVANGKHVEECLKNNIDILWIGARTTVNPFFVQEIADALQGVDIPVMIKNPVNPDLQLWIGAIERINRVGVTKIVAIHRGFHSFESHTFRNDPKWQLAIDLKLACPGLPVICDPSHICGNTTLIPYISQKAMDMDMDGLMIETHINPLMAKSDAKQQLIPEELKNLLARIIVRSAVSENKEFTTCLTRLRNSINNVDDELLQILLKRMTIAGEIGKYKKDHHVTILQTDRWEELLRNHLNNGLIMGMRSEFIKKLYQLIHEESIRIQEEVMNEVDVQYTGNADNNN